jgi:signal transduction histidine kinase
MVCGPPGAARQNAVSGGSLGLLGMEERVQLSGGSVAMTSLSDQDLPTHGTTIKAVFPIHRVYSPEPFNSTAGCERS